MLRYMVRLMERFKAILMVTFRFWFMVCIGFFVMARDMF